MRNSHQSSYIASISTGGTLLASSSVSWKRRKPLLQPSISALCVLFLIEPKLCVHPSNGRSNSRHIPVHHQSLVRFLLYNFCFIFITSHVSHTFILLLYFLSPLIEYWYKSPGCFAFIIVCTNMVISVKCGEQKQKRPTRQVRNIPHWIDHSKYQVSHDHRSYECNLSNCV